MKKILAIALVVLMVLPFGVFASADSAKLTLPQMPVASANVIGYAAASGTAGEIPAGASVTPTSGWDPINYPSSTAMRDMMTPGGIVVACGKLYDNGLRGGSVKGHE